MESEVETWLKAALLGENLKDFSLQIEGTSEKGNGYVGDVIFVKLNGNYDLVLKCSKNLAATNPEFGEAFVREIYVYNTLFPALRNFEISRDIKEEFDFVAKFYGSYRDSQKQVIVLENLKKNGFDLWDNRKPKPRAHLETVIKAYARFHAISVAMKEQEPEKFVEILKGFQTDVFTMFVNSLELVTIISKAVEELLIFFHNEFDEKTLKKLQQLNINSALNVSCDSNDLQVICHGDCWCNNFMYKDATKVAILDWQVTSLRSNIFDLSYFLMACIGSEDLKDIEKILELYYEGFTSHLQRLGTKVSLSLQDLLGQWKKYAKFGFVMCLLPVKISCVDKNNIPDMDKSVENGEEIGSVLMFNISDVTSYKNRIGPIIKYCVDNDII